MQGGRVIMVYVTKSIKRLDVIIEAQKGKRLMRMAAKWRREMPARRLKASSRGYGVVIVACDSGGS